MKRALTLDDVALVPQKTSVESRLDPSLKSYIARGRAISMPIVNSPMDTVIGPDLAKLLFSAGTIPILHRFYKNRGALEADLSALQYKDEYGMEPIPVFISCGLLGGSDLADLFRLTQLFNIVGFCIDVAHGHSVMMCESIRKIKDTFPDHKVIAGAVCTASGFKDLANAGADAIRVGIGNGSACTTRMVTGFGVPQFTALQECGEVAKELKVPMIADGGIRDSRDVVISLAAGASTVMIGKLLALTNESAAPKFTDESPGVIPETLAQYRGQASEEFQKSHYGKVKDGTVPEGVDYWAEVSGSTKELIDNLLSGLRSGMTYANAMTIEELQANAEFVEVTQSYMLESQPRTT